MAAAAATCSHCWPGNVMGRPVSSSCSLAKATRLPANEAAPIARPKISSRTCRPLGWLGWTRRNVTIETSAAAPPPTPLNTATSCGMAVIRTRRETGAPIKAPITMPIGMIP